MNSSKTLDANLDDFKKISLALSSVDEEKISDEYMAVVLLNSLTEKYRDIQTALKYGRTSLSLEDVINAVKIFDAGCLNESRSAGESLLVKGKGKKKWINRGSKQQEKSKGKQNAGGKEKRSFRCFACHEEGHFRRDCPKRKGGDPSSSGNKLGTATITEYGENDILVVSISENEDQWILDSGSTFHITYNKDWFVDLVEEESGHVMLGDSNSYKIKGTGKIKLLMKSGNEVTLTNVKYVPQMTKNLISMPTLAKLNCKIIIENNTTKVLKD